MVNINKYHKRKIGYVTMLPIILLMLLVLSPAPASYSASTGSAELQATVNPDMSITVTPDNFTLDLNPINENFESQDITTSVTTNSPNGYNLYVYSDSTSLVNQQYNDATIETLPSTDTGYSESDFPTDRWGYKAGTENYFPFVSGAIVDTASGPVDEATSTVTFGAKASYASTAGNYNLVLNFKIVAIMST